MNRRRDVIAMSLVALVLFTKSINYVVPDALRVDTVRRGAATVHDEIATALRNWPLLHHCSRGSDKRIVPGGYVCASTPDDTLWSHIYQTYPLSGSGREAIYAAVDAGDVAKANDLLANKFDIPRYPPYTLTGPLTWNEDPYHAVYWRLNFYALRPISNLLYAYRTTGNPAYARKLIEICDSFFASERASRLAWQDFHAVAFRGMILTDAWWKLRERRALSEAESTRFLRQIEKTGQFLADRNHYEPGFNHGINEAAALYSIAVAFPDLPDAASWLHTARSRIAVSLESLVDQDGVLIENSPYYHLYALDKYWQIYQYAKKFRVPISPSFKDRLRAMIRYATYILQPDLSVPLLGASLQTTIHNSRSFRKMAAEDPTFEYVLTHGVKGKRPLQNSIFFPHAGQTIMRSGWGKRSTFRNQSYLTFNVGRYRTSHSNLDALAITLFGNGKALLPGTGLYTYEHGRMRQYFHGTGSHNTVTVDGQNQLAGAAVPGKFVERDGVTYQTGASSLYGGVAHRRMVMMIDRHHFLIVDRLTSRVVHTYRQMFHLFPGARLMRDGLTVSGVGQRPQQAITIQQLSPRGVSISTVIGQHNPPSGLCSERYQVLLPCHAVAYSQHGKSATYITLLSIGPPDKYFSAKISPERHGVQIITHHRALRVGFTQSAGTEDSSGATHPRPPAARVATLLRANSIAPWQVAGSGQLSLSRAGPAVLSFRASGASPTTVTDAGFRANLAQRDLQVRMRVVGIRNLAQLHLQFSNDHWATVVTNDLREAYRDNYDGEWLNLSLGRGERRDDSRGHWTTTGPRPFDWSHIDGVRFVLRARGSHTPGATLQLAQLAASLQPRTGRVVIVFDDGYDSILPAAAYLHAKGMPANVAVIGKYVEIPSRGHLNLRELRMLQDQWGWNMVNHTWYHADAVTAYYRYRMHKLGAYAADIVRGAEFLKHAGLDSAPNWFVYPHGATNATLKRVVGRYYKFARTTDNEPETYPFGDPLVVKTLEFQHAGNAGEGGVSKASTTPAQVAHAVADTERFHSTLILTFHRIHSVASDRPGCPLTVFRQIVDDIHRQGVPVVTLSQLDQMNGVPQDNEVYFKPGVASQIQVHIEVGPDPHPGFVARLFSQLERLI